MHSLSPPRRRRPRPVKLGTLVTTGDHALQKRSPIRPVAQGVAAALAAEAEHLAGEDHADGELPALRPLQPAGRSGSVIDGSERGETPKQLCIYVYIYIYMLKDRDREF